MPKHNLIYDIHDFIRNRVKRLKSNFRGPRGYLARISRTRGVIKSIPRGIEESKKFRDIKGRGIPRAIPTLN